MAKKRIETTSQQVDILLQKAKKEFQNGKKSVTFKLPNTSKEFFNELKETAYDKYCYTVTKKLFNRVQITNGIVYKYPF